MKPGFFLLGLLFLASQLLAAEVELHLKDDQVIRGEIISANEKDVQIKTDFGVLKIPRANVANPEALAGAPAVAPIEPKVAVKGGGRLDENAILAECIRARSAGPLSAKDNADISALVGKFGEGLAFERPPIIEKLRAYCPKANGIVGISYKRSDEIEVRTRLLRSVAIPGNIGAMPAIKEAHAAVLLAYEKKLDEKPDTQSFLDRGTQRVLTKKELEKQAKAIAELLPELEDDAATVGGAGALLLLARTYRNRYVPDFKSPFREKDRDARNLLMTVVESPQLLKLGKQWTPEERALVIEKLIPDLQNESKDYRRMLEPVLAILLPTPHPAFTAIDAEWQEWWQTVRPEVLRTPLAPPPEEKPFEKTVKEKPKPKLERPDE